MPSSVCLRPAGHRARIQHCPLGLCEASSVLLLRRQCQVALNFSPVFRAGLRAGAGRMPINHAIRAHTTPPENGIGKKEAEEERNGTVKSVATAVVLAFTLGLGAMCTNWKARAEWGFPRSQITLGSSPPSTPGDPTPSTSTEVTIQTKSIQALQAVLDLKCEFGTHKPAPAVPSILLRLLDDALPPNDQPELKTYVDQLKKGDQKPVINSLYEVWMKKKISPAEYEVGLVLIDLLIHQGEYKRAEVVCQKVEPLAPSSDVRPKIRRVVLDMLLIADAFGSEKLQKKMESTAQKLIKDIQEK